MVDEDFRKKLDHFAKDFENFSDTIYKVSNEVIPQVTIDTTEILTGDRPLKMPIIHVSYKSKNNSIGSNVRTEDCLISLTHPIKSATKYEKEVSDERFYITYDTERKKNQTIADTIKLEEYWQNIVNKFSQNKSYKFMLAENERLLGEAKKLQKEIAQRIEEPWKI